MTLRSLKLTLIASIACATISGVAAAQVVEMPSGKQDWPITLDRAMRMGVTGSATVRCEVQPDGGLTGCSVAGEAPAGYGFGAASIAKAVKSVKAKPPSEGGAPTVDVTFHWDARPTP